MRSPREKEILTILLAQKQVTVAALAQRLFASESSIRRDLARLEAQQLIRRTHGGAILEETSISAMKIPFVLREMEQSDAKTVMAQQAAALVHDYDVLFLDASSSAYRLVPFLAAKRHLTVITSGVKALMKLGELGIKAISTGGELLPSGQSLVGGGGVLHDRAFQRGRRLFLLPRAVARRTIDGYFRRGKLRPPADDRAIAARVSAVRQREDRAHIFPSFVHCPGADRRDMRTAAAGTAARDVRGELARPD